MLDHEHNDLNEADLLISRMIDGAATTEEDSRFDALASAEPTLWREATLRLRDARQLTAEVEAATRGALHVDLPHPRIIPRHIGWPLAIASVAAVLIIGMSWIASTIATNRPDDTTINPIVAIPRMTHEEHFEAYMRAPYVLGDLDPEVVEVRPMTDGRVSLHFVRRIEEIAFLNPKALPVDERGELTRSAKELREMEPKVGLPN